MGNCTSCCHHFGKSGGYATKLIDHNGKLQIIKLPITAAELMLEQPGFVVSPISDLQKTRRIVALRADDELEAGKMYMLVTVSKVNCVVSEFDMAIIESKFNTRKASLLLRRNNKVLSSGAVGAPESEKCGGGGGDEDDVACLSGHKFGKYRPWKPVLEPIFE